MMMKAVLGLSAALLLTACFDVDQKMDVRDPDNVAYTINTVVDISILTAGNEDLEDVTADDFCDENDFIDGDIPEALERSVESDFDGEKITCSVTFKGALADFRDFDLTGKSDDGTTEFMILEELPGNRVRIASVFDLTDKDDEAPNFLERSMARLILGDSAFSWEIQATEIIETNGTVSEDGKTVSWDMPLTKAIANRGTHEFYVIVGFDRPWYAPIQDIFTDN